MFERITIVSPTSLGQERDYECAVAEKIALMYTPTYIDPRRDGHFTREGLLSIVPKYLVDPPSAIQLYDLMTEGASHEDIMKDTSMTRDDNLFRTALWFGTLELRKALGRLDRKERERESSDDLRDYPLIKPMFSGADLMFDMLVERVESDCREARQTRELYRKSYLVGGRGILGDRLEDEPFLRG